MPTNKTNFQLEKANRNAEKAEHNIQKTVDKMSEKVQQAVREMDSVATRMVRSFLLNNYANSGVKTQSGKLKGALSQAKAKVILGGKQPRVIVALPEGVAPYDKKHGGGDFYQAASSVNYGAVRGSTEKNAKRRKNIKNKVFKAADKKTNPGTIIVEGHALGTSKKTEAGSIETGSGGTVTQGYHFWELTSQQQSQIRDVIMEIFNRVVFQKQGD